MKKHLLLTDEMRSKMPKSTEIIINYGEIGVIFENNFSFQRFGDNCIVEDSEENLIKWKGDCDEFIEGNGSPQMERFTIFSDGKKG